MFVGEFDRSVDNAGRVALPAEFREQLGAGCYLTADPNGFVALTTAADFERKGAELLEKVSRGEVTVAALRKFSKSSNLVSVDKQGRITLDDALRQHAGIRPGEQAKLVGMLDKLEIWRPSRFETISSEDDEAEPNRVWDDT